MKFKIYKKKKKKKKGEEGILLGDPGKAPKETVNHTKLEAKNCSTSRCLYIIHHIRDCLCSRSGLSESHSGHFSDD